MTEEPPLVAPNWLGELEAKRERRVKAKLGHETGAGAACLTCEQKCPGLDLHFWRKTCKNCKCSKEDHDVPDDDVHGWAEWQLLGSKPNKIKTKITLPGRKGEVELDWAPKGQKDTVEQFLQTLPPESIPIKGSQAAQDRKQQLQKQIPIHDIDPAFCHDLTPEEQEQMNKYISHVKEKSVGVGQLINLSSYLHGVVHNLDPYQAKILRERYGKNIPLGEIVKLQPSGISKELEKLSLGAALPTFKSDEIQMEDNKYEGVEPLKHHRPLPNYLPGGKYTTYNDNQSATTIGNLKDLAYSTYDDNDERRQKPHNHHHHQQQQQGYSPNHNDKLVNYSPNHNRITEDLLQPHEVHIGSIKDIHPDIKMANFGVNQELLDNLGEPREASTTIINDLVIPNCHHCQLAFNLEEFAVTIDKSSNCLFHANCFKCAGCNQILADNMYFYHKETNNVYCLRDYAKVKGYPRCKGCDELIFTKEYCLTEDNTFHLKHFCCIECDVPLAGQNYLVENSQPVCLPCYENSKANKCLGCQKVIKPDEEGLVLKESHFHVRPDCFCCTICRKDLLGQKLLFRNFNLYCSHDCYQTDR